MTTRTCAAGTLLATLALCGCATTNNPPAKMAQTPSPCLKSTASRIPDPDCAVSGRSYSQNDLRQTGKTTAADALALVDPTVTAGH
jgi:hypothetical protein